MPSEKAKEQAKRVLVEIVRQSGGAFDNKTNLFKAFYYAHLEYAKRRAGVLSTWPIVRMPRGPGIDNFDTLCGELVAQHVLHVGTTTKGEFEAIQFRLGEREQEVGPLDGDALEAVRNAVEKVIRQSAASVSDQSHRDSREWRDTSDGDELNIYADLLDDEEYERLSRLADEILSESA